MQHSYTHYWKQETVRWNWKNEGQSFDHTAGNQFGHVRPGDRLYAVSRDDKGDLMLIGRLTVGTVDDTLSNGDTLRAILSQDQAEQAAGHELYEADHHLFAAPDSAEETTTSFRRIIQAQDAKNNLSFVSPADGAQLAPKLEAGGKLDRQTVRGVRRLTPAAAAYLDRALS